MERLFFSLKMGNVEFLTGSEAYSINGVPQIFEGLLDKVNESIQFEGVKGIDSLDLNIFAKK